MSVSPKRSKTSVWLARVGLFGVALMGGHFLLQSQGALREREQASRRKTAELRERLENAREAITEIREMEQQAASARADLDRWSHERSSGPTVVWFPLWLKAQLHRFGVVESHIRLNTEVPEPGLSGFKRTCWNVILPPQSGMRNMTAALLAVNEIEQRERFVKVLDCSLRSDAEEPHWPAVSFNVEALIRE